MSKDFQVTVHEPTRAAEFEKIFGSATVCVTTGFPVMCMIEKVERPCYMLDLKELGSAQKAALVKHLANKFGADAEDVVQAIYNIGLPILAEECTLIAKGDGAFMTLAKLNDLVDTDDDFDYDYDLDDREWED
jgi:hypothetical protein